MIRVSLALIALAGLARCTKPKAEQAPIASKPAGVTVEIVDAPQAPGQGDTGYWPNLLVDKEGALHVAYCDGNKGDAKLGHRKPDGKWELETVEEKGAVGKYMSALWTDGPELVYLDQTRKTLRYAKKAAGAWQFQDVASDKEDIGISGRFLLGPKGERIFLYYNTRNELMMSTGAGSPLLWKTETLAKAGAVFNIQIDAVALADTLLVSYPDWNVSRSTLFLAQANNPQAAKKVDDEGIAGLKSALVPAAAGMYDIYYMSSRGGLLYKATQKGDDFTRTQLFSNIANFAALKLSDGRMVLALQVGRADGLGEGAVHLAIEEQGKWTQYAIDETRPVGQYLSLAETKGEARPVINLAYYDGAKKALKLARIP